MSLGPGVDIVAVWEPRISDAQDVVLLIVVANILYTCIAQTHNYVRVNQ